MAIGSSKYGFWTHLDRERINQVHEWKARATEARDRADELEAEYLARGLDPIIRDILADLMSADKGTQCDIVWDGKATWLVHSGSRSSGKRWVQIRVVTAEERTDKERLYLEVVSEELPKSRYWSETGEVYEASGAIRKLQDVLQETTGLRVRLFQRSESGRNWVKGSVTLGTSKYGFETRKDRESARLEELEQARRLEEATTAKELKEREQARRLEEEARAKELEVENLAKEFDPVISDILVDLVSAYEMTGASVEWDGKDTWRVHDSTQQALIEIRIEVQELIRLVLFSAPPHMFRADDDVARDALREAIPRLREVLRELTKLPVGSSSLAS